MHKGHGSVLVVEDEADLRQLIADRLESRGFAVAQAAGGGDALERINGFAYDGLVVDLRLPDGNGMDVLKTAIDRHPQIRSVVITGFGGVEDAVSALELGAVDFLIKPFQLVQLEQILQVAINERRLEAENAELRAQLRERFQFDRIIGSNDAMRRVFATLELVAPMHSTVLIHGETGTGKELIARTIHYNSPRRDQRFVAFNAAAVPDSLAEAELFGHVKGALTGAVQSRAGRLELADKGTLFIDEVGAMSTALQSKLLRALQEREVERVGDSKPHRIDVRVVAATNVDLRRAIKDGTFREDLFYCLNVVPIVVPPLRARREDIALLAKHFARQSSQQNGVPPRTLSQASLRVLMEHDWPGNIRELENAIEHAVAMSGREQEIVPSMLPEAIRTQPQLPPAQRSEIEIPDEGINFASTVAQLERDLITRSLEKTGGNKRHAARLLQLSRTTLIDKLNRLGIRAENRAETI
jgi:two-component system, NtrC family, response regulator AtoC